MSFGFFPRRRRLRYKLILIIPEFVDEPDRQKHTDNDGGGESVAISLSGALGIVDPEVEQRDLAREMGKKGRQKEV